MSGALKRYVCIHGHFYQPPRENPWLEAIELQDSAYPYHDWNQRIAVECYAPCSAARILDDAGRVRDIVNDYARISFNVGPTLLAWLEQERPDVYAAILEADRDSARRFGHGSAMAQAYNHVILPLASRRDKLTQIRWGIRDFERRFGRRPEGMWLPETAVDLETLDIMAAEGIAFTVLAPHQAARVRPIGGDEWTSVDGGRVDPRRPYRIDLSDGRRMALFFYDGPVALAVAFERLLDSGEAFANRLIDALGDGGEDAALLAHIATDGESYGHHHPYGEMALAYALRTLEERGDVELTNYASFLERHPPEHEVEIHQNTSWSCAHGIERWREDCGCRVGDDPGWSQAWRRPLREALDWLRDRLVELYERRAPPLLGDPWAARDDYVDIVLDRSRDAVAAFLSRHAAIELDPVQRSEALRLLEIQRQAQLMFTSCGWFFDDLSNIETVQVLGYAGRAIQLAEQLEPAGLGRELEARLARAESNIAEQGDGSAIYERTVVPTAIDFSRLTAHYAVHSLFHDYPEESKIYNFRVRRRDFRLHRAGRARLACGLVEVTSRVTQESAQLGFGVLHLGDHNLSGGVRATSEPDDYEAMVTDVTHRFEQGDLPGAMHQLDEHLDLTYSLHSLFRDQQRWVLDRLVDVAMADAQTASRRLYDQHAALMRYLVTLRYPVPGHVRAAADFVLNTRLRSAIEADPPDVRQIRQLVEEARILDVELDAPGLGLSLQRAMETIAQRFAGTPDDTSRLRQLRDVAELARVCPFPVDTYTVQVLVFRLGHDGIHARRDDAEWRELFREVSESLRVRID